MTTQAVFAPGATWVVKIGSSLLTDNGQGLAVGLVNDWVDDLARASRNGVRVVIVSSGAVAEGMLRLGFEERPKSLHLLQATAAVGQMGLIQLYESSFQRHQMRTAQVLLTHDDLRSRERYINARSTLRDLLDLGVIPVVNENDTVVTDEIRFGDNDTLAALVANLIEANTLILLTDQKGLFSSDPGVDKNAELVPSAKASDGRLDAMAGGSSTLGLGGMKTKIAAARIAARSGANTVIVSGRETNVLQEIAVGAVSGTLLTADKAVLVSRKQWLATLPVKGKLILDQGAVEVLRTRGRSLLPVGVKRSEGEFTRGEIVSCVSEEGAEIARGLVNYSQSETVRIIGRASREIESILGYIGDEELIHRDNLILS
jgi:glutamate 5-kinase|tara:strand:+ start:5627 stop:6745 length:1119 start_codon:yes stop_codon:yes gene_type:complete